MAQSPATFSGKLDGRLYTDPSGKDVVVWDEAKPDDANSLGVSFKSGDRFFKGKLELSRDPVIAFDAAIVRSSDGTDVAYVDIDKDGRFEENERFQFQPIDPGETAVEANSGNPETSSPFKSRAGMDIPLPTGPFRTCPMEIFTLNTGVQVTNGPNVSAGASKILVAYTNEMFVQGTAQLPDRSLLTRFEYSFKQNTVDLKSAVEWFDVRGHGSRRAVNGIDPELRKAEGKPPLFRVGSKLVVTTQSVDLATNAFVLRSVPPQDYHLIDLVAGMTIPDFSFTDFNGKTHNLSEIKAKYLLLDFWYSYCAPCMADLPSKVKVYEEFHDRGFEILGMNGADDESIEKVQKLLTRMKVAWPQARYEEHLFRDRLLTPPAPSFVLLDADRKILSTGSNQHLPLDGINLEKTLQALLKDH